MDPSPPDDALVRRMQQLTTLASLQGRTTSLDGHAVTTLDVSRNRLTSDKAGTFDSLSAFSQLTALDLSLNLLSELPLPELSALKNLVELNAAHNCIEVLRGLEHAGLTSLDLTGNGIRQIGAVQLQALRTLRLANNDIAVLDGLRGLGALTDLDASRNRIADMQAVALLPNLTLLDLSENAVADSHQAARAVAGLGKLEQLSLHRNPCSTGDAADGHYRVTLLRAAPSLKFLDEAEVKEFTREQLASATGLRGTRTQAEVENLVGRITAQFHERMETERARNQRKLKDMQKEQQDSTSSFMKYEAYMQREMQQIVGFLLQRGDGSSAQLPNSPREQRRLLEKLDAAMRRREQSSLDTERQDSRSLAELAAARAGEAVTRTNMRSNTGGEQQAQQDAEIGAMRVLSQEHPEEWASLREEEYKLAEEAEAKAKKEARRRRNMAAEEQRTERLGAADEAGADVHGAAAVAQIDEPDDDLDAALDLFLQNALSALDVEDHH